MPILPNSPPPVQPDPFGLRSSHPRAPGSGIEDRPIPCPGDLVYGVRLVDLLARCRSMAHRFYRKHGRWEPYEEYLSAGHLAIAECLQRYNPALATSGGFLSYCCFQMEMKMRDVRRVAAGPWNMPKHVKGTYQEPKYTVEGWEHELLYALRSEQARQDTVAYLHEIVGYLATQGKPSAMLYAQLDGDSEQEIAEQWHCTPFNVRKHLAKTRQRLRAWAAWSAA